MPAGVPKLPAAIGKLTMLPPCGSPVKALMGRKFPSVSPGLLLGWEKKTGGMPVPDGVIVPPVRLSPETP